MKICIIGYEGSGKSQLAIKLGKKYQVPVLHLDLVRYITYEKQRSYEEMKKIIDEFISENKNGYVIDGNYFLADEDRFKTCDLLIFLSFSRLYCYRKSRARYKENKTIDRLTNPCIEHFNFSFRKWILLTGRTRVKRKEYKKIMNLCINDKKILYNERDLKRYLDLKN